MKFVKFFPLLVLVLPAFATADPIHVSFEGTVYSGHGGYSYGDTINGYFDFDSDDLNYTSDCSAEGADVSSSADTGSGSNSLDYVYSCSYGSFDRMIVREGTSGYSYPYDRGYRYDYSYLVIDLYDFFGRLSGDWSDAWYDRSDWTSGTGEVRTYNYGYEGGQGSFYENSRARFYLTSVHIGGMKVSEPGTLALLGLGLIGLGFARRRKTV